MMIKIGLIALYFAGLTEVLMARNFDPEMAARNAEVQAIYEALTDSFIIGDGGSRITIKRSRIKNAERIPRPQDGDIIKLRKASNSAAEESFEYHPLDSR